MSIDPWASQCALRDSALESAQGTDIADEYERGAIGMAWADLTGETTDINYDATLRVELRGMGNVDAYAAGTVAQAVQQATAIMARHQLEPSKKFTRIGKRDRSRALLIQEAQNGNVVWFRVPSAQPGEYLVSSGERAAQRAVRNLVEFLPRTEGDDAAVDGILGAVQPVRRAMNEIAIAATTSTEGLGLRFSINGVPPIDSLLTKERARALRETLSAPEVLSKREDHVGRVDGMRNSRRVLYVVDDDKREIAVSVGDDQLSRVQELIGRRVLARVESRQSVQPNGANARKVYRLIELTEDAALFGT